MKLAPFVKFREEKFGAVLFETRSEKVYTLSPTGAAVLREVARRLGVSPQITDATTKHGLFLPWAQWTQSTGERGAWDRASFAIEMRAAWRQAFLLT